MADRAVYILLTRSGTWFSRLIHFATRDDYTHASIGLDGPAGPFYSFARKYERFALPAGLVEERVGPGAGDSRRSTPCCLYALTVPEPAYRRLRERLAFMYGRRELYHYNLLGALSCGLNLPLARRRHYFCSQFVAELLQGSGAAVLPKEPALLRPADFQGLRGLRPIHLGSVGAIPAGSAA